jgi:hypothetical protein
MASLVFMVRPKSFGFDPETAQDNAFQQREDGSLSRSDIQTAALTEFDGFVNVLIKANIDVFVLDDVEIPAKPNAVFPNNWISFHPDGLVILYPMKTASRRIERRTDFFDDIRLRGANIDRVVDLAYLENSGKYLEGTGSLVFDYENSAAYAAVSERTSTGALAAFSEVLTEYYLHAFEAVDRSGVPIYHTNVMMCIARSYAIICLESIRDSISRESVLESLKASGREIIEIFYDQLENFAGNMLEVLDKDTKESKLVMSSAALRSLTADQVNAIRRHSEILSISIPTIEKYGGGSVRCMLCKVI